VTIALLVWLGLNALVFFCGTIGNALEQDKTGVITGACCFFGHAFFFVAVLMRALR
jgi:hypothetical protein